MSKIKIRGGSPPYGWRYDGGKYIEDPEEQTVLTQVKLLFARAIPIMTIARAISTKYKNRAGGDFTAVQIRRMLETKRRISPNENMRIVSLQMTDGEWQSIVDVMGASGFGPWARSVLIAAAKHIAKKAAEEKTAEAAVVEAPKPTLIEVARAAASDLNDEPPPSTIDLADEKLEEMEEKINEKVNEITRSTEEAAEAAGDCPKCFRSRAGCTCGFAQMIKDSLNDTTPEFKAFDITPTETGELVPEAPKSSPTLVPKPRRKIVAVDRSTTKATPKEVLATVISLRDKFER